MMVLIARVRYDPGPGASSRAPGFGNTFTLV